MPDYPITRVLRPIRCRCKAWPRILANGKAVRCSVCKGIRLRNTHEPPWHSRRKKGYRPSDHEE